MQSPHKIRVLIAEDHFVARIGIGTVINAQRDMGVVAEAMDGTEALAGYRKYLPDIVLMDMLMPVMDGFEAVTKICSEFPTARILALSTYESDEDIHRAFRAGVKAYLTKDVLRDELINAIRVVHGGERYLPLEIQGILKAEANRADLTPRELEVLRLIALGETNKEIAGSLGISDQTVKNHLRSIFSKLEADDRTGAVTTAIQRGVIRIKR